MMKRIRIALIITLAFFVIIASIHTAKKTRQSSQDIGPLFFYALDGQKISYNDTISPSKTVLFLWTSECTVCKDEIIRLSKECALYEDINVIYINLGETKRAVERFLSHYGVSSCILGNVLLDAAINIRRKFIVIGVPTVIFFKDGVPVDISYTLDDHLIKKVFGDG